MLEPASASSAPRALERRRQPDHRGAGGRQAFRRYIANLRRMKPSLSSFIVHAAASLPLCERHLRSFLYASYGHDQAYRSCLAGDPSWLSVTVPTLADPSLAPAGEQLLILTTRSLRRGNPLALGEGSLDRSHARNGRATLPGSANISNSSRRNAAHAQRYTQHRRRPLWMGALARAGRLRPSLEQHADLRAAAGRALDTAGWRSIRRGVIGDLHRPQRARNGRPAGSRLAWRRCPIVPVR